MERTFERTHPWLKFSLVQLHRSLQPELWSMLGECQSNCEHIAGVPLPPSVAHKLHDLYLAKGVLGTTAIEGNTLSEEEVLRYLDGELKLPPSREYLTQEIDNIIQGCGLIVEAVARDEPLPLDAETFRSLNKITRKSLVHGTHDAPPGGIRRYSVGVMRYRGAPAEDCEYLLNRLGEWLSGDDFKVPPNLAIVWAIIRAVVAHLYLAWIHAFADGNGRTARLVEFQILFASGVPTPVAHLLSNHYNLTRTEYYRQLDYASRSGGDILPFLKYAVGGFRDGTREQLHKIRAFQLEMAWRNFVHEEFADKKNPPDKRRRDLVLDLSLEPQPVPFPKLTSITKRSVAAYHGKTRMTLRRDVNKLVQMGLIGKSEKGYVVNRHIIQAFLPKRATRE